MLRDWEPVKTLPHPYAALEIAGEIWRVVDEIVMLDQASEARHGFLIHDAKDAYPQRATLRYPDGTYVTDAGYGQLEGCFAFSALGLTVGRPIVILHRTDYIMSNYRLDVSVGGERTGEIACDGADRVHRWRNWPIPIAADHVTGPSVNIRLQALTPGRDVHMFHVWVYQLEKQPR